MAHVLVVDDSALMRRVLTQMLRTAGFRVSAAGDGRQALQLLEDDPPDVVTLDVTMPGMSGLTCLAEIMRRSPRPVVMVSTLTERGALVTLEALELGAVDFVAKPGGEVSLGLDRVRDELVEKVRRAARARVAAPRGLRERARQPRPVPVAGRDTPRTRELTPVGSGVRAPERRTAPRGAARVEAAPAPVRPPRVELVLVGASTGGPALVMELVRGLPAGLRPAVVIAQHMPASFTGPLARRMDAVSAVPVREVTGTEPLEPGTVYVGAGDADVVVRGRPGELTVRRLPADPRYAWHPSVDRLVESALGSLPAPRLLGVLLTGMGRDGAEQMTRLKEGGGRTIAESEESAVVWGMPGDLVRRGGASHVVAADELLRAVTRWTAA